jgi:hypothetical protein
MRRVGRACVNFFVDHGQAHYFYAGFNKGGNNPGTA